ncbi:MAG: ABC transporter substrate-binding protein [Pirellulaceae bacterium]|nr:ABC transporter substrate-binding protein [Pirellulaceae bacterium]
MNRLLQISTLLLFSSTVVLLSTVGCDSRDSKSTPTKSAEAAKDKVVLMLNWYPEAEHGGFFAAKVHGIFDRYGLDVEIRPGGPNAPVVQELVTGRVQFGIANASDALLYRQQDAKVVALLAPIRNSPRCIVVREDSGATELSGLKGMTLQANQGRPFLDFMKSKGLLDGVQVVPYGGSVAKLVTDKNTAIQGYSFSEPFMAKQQGAAVRVLMVSDIGYNPYASCLVCTEDYLNTNTDLASRMTAACQEGWQQYFQSATQTNAEILANNKEGMTAEALAYGVDILRPLCLPEGVSPTELGAMTAARWEELVGQFVELGLVDANKVKANEVFKTLAPPVKPESK